MLSLTVPEMGGQTIAVIEKRADIEAALRAYFWKCEIEDRSFAGHDTDLVWAGFRVDVDSWVIYYANEDDAEDIWTTFQSGDIVETPLWVT